MRDQLDTLLDQAGRAEMNLREALALLCGAEVARRDRSVAEWEGVFGDAVVATAILDRLLHHSPIVTIRGDSYRLRAKRRAGLVHQASAQPTEITQ